MLRDSGFSGSEIQLLVASANSFRAGTRTLGAQAKTIHEGIRSKQLDQDDGIQRLTALDQSRDLLLAKILDELRGDLGRDGWNRLETLLRDKIAPAIVVVSR